MQKSHVLIHKNRFSLCTYTENYYIYGCFIGKKTCLPSDSVASQQQIANKIFIIKLLQRHIKIVN